MPDFKESPTKLSPRDFPDLIKQEAEARGFHFKAGKPNPNSPTRRMRITAPKCTLEFKISVDDVPRTFDEGTYQQTVLRIWASQAESDDFDPGLIEFKYASDNWHWAFAGFRTDWLAWLLCEYADKGHAVIFDSPKLAHYAEKSAR
jgi:hypothetical protein